MIISKSNDKIKYIRKLKENKYINKEKKFIVETENLVNEASKTGYLLETISLVEKDYGVNNTLVSSDVMKSITSLKTTPKVIGICKLISNNDYLGDRVIILDNIQDPGNLGTIIRSACAFGIDTIVLGKTCVNMYNEKVIRASEGMIFKVNIMVQDLTSFISKLIQDGYKVYGTNVVDGISIKKIDKENKVAVIMGNEGNGLSDEVKSMISKNIYIDINKSCESLNVAVAASIIMYELGSDR